MANVNVDLACDEKEKVVGDSVGAIVGYAAGDEKTGVTIDSCKVLSGSIVGYDAVAGIVGRSYSVKITISNCENAATVTAIRRASGILGFISKDTIDVKEVSITNCKNSGNVKQTGTPTTDPADKTQKGYGYYMVAGLAICVKGTPTLKIDIAGSLNKGTVTLTVEKNENKSDLFLHIQ